MTTQTTKNAQNSEAQLPTKYQEFANVFDKVKTNTLLEHGPYDCSLKLYWERNHHGAQSTTCYKWRLKFLKLTLMRIWRTGPVYISNPYLGHPSFYAKKKDSSLWLVMDYWGFSVSRYGLHHIQMAWWSAFPQGSSICPNWVLEHFP